MQLSDLPDDILKLISIRLNGFDNCFLWMASDSKLKQRLVGNIITDFDIMYTTPGRYLWPGNFLKKLQKLSRLSLVADRIRLPIQNIELFPIPTLKYLKFSFFNSSQIFNQNGTISSNKPTDPTSYINLNDYYGNLEHLEIVSPFSKCTLKIEFLRLLPKNLKTLLIPNAPIYIDHNDPINLNIELLPRTLTELHLRIGPDDNPSSFDVSRLPPNLTSLNINLIPDDKSCHMIPKGIKKLDLMNLNFGKLSPYVPLLESLSIQSTDPESLILQPTDPTSEMFLHLKNLEYLFLNPTKEKNDLNNFLADCPKRMKTLICFSLDLTDFVVPTRLFSDCLTTLKLYRIFGLTSEFISSLPQSIIHLEFSEDDQVPFAYFSHLPRKLQRFLTSRPIAENTSLLPETLTHLEFRTTEKYDKSYFDRLPPKLETFETSDVIPVALVEHLPASLTALVIMTDEPIDDDILSILPRGLKRLSISAGDNITDAGVADLPPFLKTLTLHGVRKVTYDAIAFLPRSLTSLSIFNNTNFTDECIKHLPRNLTHLRIDKAKKIFKSHKDLPPYLNH